ncbi:MAG: peptide-methionine (R)-S-oxide reductase MsrB [Aureliella sp.]
MNHQQTKFAGILSVAALIFSLGLALASEAAAQSGTKSDSGPPAAQPEVAADLKSAVLAGGCFWCIESDFEKCPGVVNVISGYSGGRTKQPNYKNYAAGGHREVVFLVYDPKKVTFAGLVEWLVKHTDPTNSTGQFVDKGKQYSPAIYYESMDERNLAEQVIKAFQSERIFGLGKINIALRPRQPFWPAEQYHQDYHTTNPTKYQAYRSQCGRDPFVMRFWGARAKKLELPISLPADVRQEMDEKVAETPAWKKFQKPSLATLRAKLTPIQFKVTQQDGTEPAFNNKYWDNKKEGIYVDVISGAPLFSSVDKFKSGTGWPSFVKPIDREAVYFKADRKLFYTRTEVRSRFGDSHLGHVFNDGPRERGGKRYCMNSAAMRFVPKEDMEKEGYGDYLKLFD